jgi:hypothetical protein
VEIVSKSRTYIDQEAFFQLLAQDWAEASADEGAESWTVMLADCIAEASAVEIAEGTAQGEVVVLVRWKNNRIPVEI